MSDDISKSREDWAEEEMAEVKEEVTNLPRNFGGRGWTGSKERKNVLLLLKKDLSVAMATGAEQLVTYIEMLIDSIREGEHAQG